MKCLSKFLCSNSWLNHVHLQYFQKFIFQNEGRWTTWAILIYKIHFLFIWRDIAPFFINILKTITNTRVYIYKSLISNITVTRYHTMIKFENSFFHNCCKLNMFNFFSETLEELNDFILANPAVNLFLPINIQVQLFFWWVTVFRKLLVLWMYPHQLCLVGDSTRISLFSTFSWSSDALGVGLFQSGIFLSQNSLTLLPMLSFSSRHSLCHCRSSCISGSLLTYGQ